MLSPLRNRFGIPGVISVIALVFAMVGGAYAASNGGGGKATASAKAKKGPRGPRGPAGPAGPAGPTGPAGAKGDTGAAGSNGSNGKDGVSVTSKTVPTSSATCSHLGGSEFTSASGTTTACNGKEGEEGEPGEPGAIHPGETLPSEASETGVWGSPFHLEGFTQYILTFSFNIPLASALGESNVHYINPSGLEVPAVGSPVASSKCQGTVAAPTAAPGNLCVYATFEENTNFKSNAIENPVTDGTAGAATTGAIMKFIPPNESVAQGTWAVTAP